MFTKMKYTHLPFSGYPCPRRSGPTSRLRLQSDTHNYTSILTSTAKNWFILSHPDQGTTRPSKSRTKEPSSSQCEREVYDQHSNSSRKLLCHSGTWGQVPLSPKLHKKQKNCKRIILLTDLCVRRLLGRCVASILARYKNLRNTW